MLAEAKAFEAKAAIERDATEIDMVINVGALKSGNRELVEYDISSVAACKGGADFVKISTGFSTGGAVSEDVALMRKTFGPELGVKASGGIRDLDATLEMIKAGASRIGASAGVKIIEQADK